MSSSLRWTTTSQFEFIYKFGSFSQSEAVCLCIHMLVNLSDQIITNHYTQRPVILHGDLDMHLSQPLTIPSC